MCFKPSGCDLSATSSTSQKPVVPSILGPARNSLYGLRGGTRLGMNHVASSILMLSGFFESSSASLAGVIRRDG